MWTRPTALQSAKYVTALKDDLDRLYMSDCQKAQTSTPPVTIPPRSKHANLRIAQWNVHYFCGYNNVSTIDQVFDDLNQHHADVIILNEFGTADPMEHAPFLKRMQKVGYKHYKAANIGWPTVILTRMEHVDVKEEFPLDESRRAVVMRLQLPPLPSPSPSSSSTTTTTTGISKDGEAQHRPCCRLRQVWIYGTHLNDYEDYSGRRQDEMKKLLNFHIENNMEKNDPALIVGDFNQQRPVDYLDKEWQRIANNKALRGVKKFTDGVDELLASHGFACLWNKGVVPRDARNWDPIHPPPSTHWTGTLIDYVYYSSRYDDDNVQNVGAYISPSDLSDHRLIVTDWKIS